MCGKIITPLQHYFGASSYLLVNYCPAFHLMLYTLPVILKLGKTRLREGM